MQVCSGGQIGLLNGLLPTLRRLELRLFVNDHTPAQEDTAADYTEPTYQQYQPLPLSDWQAVRPTADGHAILKHDLCRFPSLSVSPAVLVFGVWVADGQGRLWWGERLPLPPFSLEDGGDDLTVIPQLVLRGFS